MQTQYGESTEKKKPFEYTIDVYFPLGKTTLTFNDKSVYNEWIRKYRNVKEFIQKTGAEKIGMWIKEGKLSFSDIKMGFASELNFNNKTSPEKLLENIERVQGWIANAKVVDITKKKMVPIKSPQLKELTKDQIVAHAKKQLILSVENSLEKLSIVSEQKEKIIKIADKYFTLERLKTAMEEGKNIGMVFDLYERKEGRVLISGCLATVKGDKTNLIVKFDVSPSISMNVEPEQPFIPVHPWGNRIGESHGVALVRNKKGEYELKTS